MISVVCSFLDNILTPACFESMEYWFVFCFTFAVGTCLCEVDGVDYRKQFSNWWKGEMRAVKYPSKGSIFARIAGRPGAGRIQTDSTGVEEVLWSYVIPNVSPWDDGE